MNEPSSRSYNPFGYNYFGFINITRVLYIGKDSFLVQWNTTWSLMRGETTKNVDQTLEQILTEKDWQ